MIREFENLDDLRAAIEQDDSPQGMVLFYRTMELEKENDILRKSVESARSESREIYANVLVSLRNKNNEYSAELRNIAHAKRENFKDAEEFRQWAQNRAQNALGE